MSFEEIIIPSRDLYSLSVHVFEANEPKAVVKIIHGMEEHQNRYIGFAEFLVEHGYTVVTADMRGHGKNAPKLSHIADKKGHELILQDEEVILNYIKEKYQDLPIILLGHSMGTIIARNVLQKHSYEYSKVVLSGYPNPNGAASIAIMLNGLTGIFKGRKGYSKTINDLVIGGFAKSIPNPESPCDWLSYNKENVQNYLKDPLCGEMFTIGSYSTLFHLLKTMGKASRYKKVKEHLPILLISGNDDPCTGGEKGRNDSLKVLQKAGFKEIEVETIPNMRHEILLENDKEKTYDLILKFLEK